MNNNGSLARGSHRGHPRLRPTAAERLQQAQARRHGGGVCGGQHHCAGQR